MTSTKKPEGWIETTLGKIVDVRSGSTPSTKEETYWDGDISWITPKDLSHHDKRFIDRGEKNITELGLTKSSAQLLPKNTVLFSSRAPIGYVAIANKELTTNQGFKNLVCDEKISHFMFFYYWLNFKKDYIEGLASGSTFSEISGSGMKSLPVLLPSYVEQKSIAKILSSFDEKIELLRDENQTLEEIGKTIFKQYFGKYKVGDKLPNGWKYGVLGEIGGQISERVKDGKERVVLSAVNSGNLVLSKEYFSKQVFSEDIAKYIICNPGDFAYNPARINIGSIGRNFCWNGAVSPVYVVFRPKETFGKYLEYIFKSKRFKDHVEKYANGSVRQTLNYDGFSRFELLIPDIGILDKFNENLEVFENKIEANKKQIEKLTETRDKLLPKLMNGELRVVF